MTTLTTPILSEDYARAIRNGDLREAGKISPCMACLPPLLQALGWHDFHRELLEALPHYAAHLDIAELRNILVNMGYETHAIRLRPETLTDELLPALLVTNSGRVLMLESHDGEQWRYFDGEKNEFATGQLPERGTTYVVTDRAHSSTTVDTRVEPWFNAMLRRFKPLLKHLLGATFLLNIIAASVPLFIMFVYDRVIGAKALDSLPYVVAGISLALGVELGLRVMRSVTLGTIAGRIDHLIGTASFKQILSMPPLMTERSSVTAQLSKLRQLDAIRDFFAGQTATTLLEGPFVVIFLGVIAILGGWLAVIPPVVALCYFLFGLLWQPRMRRNLALSSRARTRREEILMETFDGLRELKALGAEATWLERYRELTTQSVLASRNASLDQAVLNGVTTTVLLLSASAFLGFGTLQVMAGNMSVGALIASMALSWRVQAPLQGLFFAACRFESIVNGIRDLNQLMSLKTEKQGGKSSLMTTTIDGRVAFDRVSFRYAPNADPALLGVSFEVPAQGFLAVVGNNGSGKSTLLKLINGLYPIQSGRVYIDGVDSRQFEISDLRRLVAYVPQNPSLYRGTIAQNLRMKDPLATDDDLRLACFKTGILRMVESLPDGFNTPVGDANTQRLPSGLIRGICIARAFVRRSPILVMDEPASGLDSDSDEALMLQLRSLKGQITAIMASHRPSHIKLADRVLVIDGGVAQRLCTPDEYFAPPVTTAGASADGRTRAALGGEKHG